MKKTKKSAPTRAMMMPSAPSSPRSIRSLPVQYRDSLAGAAYRSRASRCHRRQGGSRSKVARACLVLVGHEAGEDIDQDARLRHLDRGGLVHDQPIERRLGLGDRQVAARRDLWNGDTAMLGLGEAEYLALAIGLGGRGRWIIGRSTSSVSGRGTASQHAPPQGGAP